MENNATLGQRRDSDSGMTNQVETTTPNQTYPSHGTQAARFLAALLAGRQINPLLAWQDFGIYRTSDVVFRLRKLGWPVKTDNLAVDNRFGEACIVALYSLPGEVIDQAGSDAREFVCTERETLREMRRAP
jgi:hypothetical protein